ncbi:MAG: hypothetical protein LAO51_10645, partial [Acidobacteriia bacterium]|nr:hypothetical protein [Terriglobia bacterium]
SLDPVPQSLEHPVLLLAAFGRQKKEGISLPIYALKPGRISERKTRGVPSLSPRTRVERRRDVAPQLGSL